MKKNKFKYINNFPLIVMAIVAILIIILVNVYLIFKPYKSVYKNGYFVLSQNMTANLISNNSKIEDLDVGVAKISYGDSLYKKLDSYYVGIEQKQEVDMDYPVYSSDGLTIYGISDNFRLINENFEVLNGYEGIYINKGYAYNDSDNLPMDDLSYLFYLTDNSIYINTQIINVKTFGNNYTIPVNSPLGLSKDSLNYYVFDGTKFTYHRISDISYDSIITIGNANLTYEEFLLKLNAIKSIEKPTEEIKIEIGEVEVKESPKVEKIPKEEEYIKPEVSVKDFKPDVYSITSNIEINDPKGYITSNPKFEIYDSSDKLYSRKSVSKSGDFKISGLHQDEEYKIVGTYKYINKYGRTMISTFYVGNIKTLSIDYLNEIILEKDIGKRYPNKIEIKNLKIKNIEINALEGIKKVSLNVWKENNKDSLKTFEMPYNNISKLLKGEEVVFESSNKLNSNTVYNYEIKFYDSTGLEIKSINNTGTIQTSLQNPTVSYKAKIDNKLGSAIVYVTTNNKDNVNIHNYLYKLLDESNNEIKSGTLDFENNKENKLDFENLNYGANYKLLVYGEYDLLDGEGIRLLESEKMFTISSISKNLVAWYEYDEKEDIKTNSLNVDIYLSNKLNYLSRSDILISVYLLDKDDNIILDSDGNKKHVKEYSGITLNSKGYSISDVFFDGLDPDTEYKIGLEVKIDQFGEDIVINKILTPSIKTLAQDAYINVIYKKLLGNTLDVSFEIIDVNKKIGNSNGKNIIVEVYDGKYDNPNINKQFIYRKVFELEENDTNPIINLTLDEYNLDNYTVIVKTDFYSGSKIQKYIEIKNEDSYDKTIIVDKNIIIKSEIQEQLKIKNNSNFVKTSINVFYNELAANLYIVDCISDNCNMLGYISPDKMFTPIVADNSVIVNYLGNVNDLNKSNILIDNELKNEDHSIYFVIEKPFIELKNQNDISLDDLKSKSYIMNYLDYNTGNEIYNIDEARDFFDTNLIKTSGETRYYVVTNNIDFKETDENGNDNYLINNTASKLIFNGSIDFQGYSVELYRLDNNNVNNYSDFRLFSRLSKTGVLKNAVLNYHLDYDGITKGLFGFVENNLGTIENIVVNIYQKNEGSRSYGIGSLAYQNSGIIRKFAVYLHSNFYTYNNSYIVNYSNSNTGIIEDGFVASYPDLNNNYRVLLYDNSSSHGTFSLKNSGAIQNCYNLLDVVHGEENPKGININTISNSNSQTATVKNTISIARTTTLDKYTTGPNVKDGNPENILNNYYVDLSNLSTVIGNKFNKKINKAVLRNKGIWEFIINKNSSYTINNGYYPVINMNLFMNDYQPLIDIGFDYNSYEMDILATEVIESDIDNNKYKVKVLVNNRNDYNIDSIEMGGITTKVLEQEYDKDNLITTVILELSLETNDEAKSSYNITKLYYSAKESSDSDIKFSGHVSYIDNPKKIDINIYRPIYNYRELVEALNKNENIYLKNDIEVSDNDINVYNEENTTLVNLPSSDLIYTAIFNGNEKYINFKNANIARGYFINNLNGNLYNLGVRNLKIQAGFEELYLGFIKEANTAVIENVDIDKSSIIIDRQGKNSSTKMYIGLLAAKTNNTNLSRISINNSNINKIKNYTGIIYGNDIGGIVGYINSGFIKNSYVYNLEIDPLKIDTSIGVPTLGGIVGEAYYTTISSCYSHGKISTGYRNVGGIVGTNTQSTINNNYSVMSILSNNNYVSGIVGFRSGGSSISNNLFIGKLYNESANKDFYSISDVFSTNNYTYEKVSSDSNSVKIITKNLLTFSNNESFIQNNSSENNIEGMPYLEESSFAYQKIADIKFNPDGKIKEPLIEYQLDEDCIQKIDSSFKDDTQYKNACATSAILTFEDGIKIKDEADYIIAPGKTGYTENEALQIENLGNNKYSVIPQSYLNSYKFNLEKDNSNDIIPINMSFYFKVNNLDDWNKIKSRQNVILLENVSIEPDDETEGIINTSSVAKSVSNLLGNNKTITTNTGKLSYPVISKISGTMRDVNFNNIRIYRNTNYTGLISSNLGKISNCSFKNIIINNDQSVTGIIALNNGYVDTVFLDNISITGNKIVGGLAGYETSGDTLNIHISNIKSNNVFISGENNIGGVAGFVGYPISDIASSNTTVVCNGRCSYVGGIIGQKSSISDSVIENAKIYAQGSYIGGAGGYGGNVSDLSVKNIEIYDDYSEISNNDSNNEIQKYFDDKINSLKLKEKYPKNKMTSGGNIGGIYGQAYSVTNSNAENISLLELNASSVGGIAGRISNKTQLNKIENSVIHGKNNVGGIVGNANLSVLRNAVVGTQIEGDESNVGGIVGVYNTSSLETSINYNQVMSSNEKLSNIIGEQNVGGIVGNIENESNTSQDTTMNCNMVFNTNISGNNAGGIIGRLYTVPESTNKKYFRGVFYGKVNNESPILSEEGRHTLVIGKIDNFASLGYYVENKTIESFAETIRFVEYVNTVNNEILQGYQIASLEKLKSDIIPAQATIWEYPVDKYGYNYFPVIIGFKEEYKIKEKDYIIIPENNDSVNEAEIENKVAQKISRNKVSSKKTNISYNLYSSDVDKINIEFSEVDSNSKFYYEIGEYRSSLIPIDKLTYTIYYDYKTPIKIYLEQGTSTKEDIYTPDKLCRTISLVGNKTYYIYNKALYSEDKAILGNFVNLYNSKALTSNGEIYDVETKEQSKSNINYSLLDYSKPLYKFNYNDSSINTYYNYSLVNDEVKDYQIMVKNGNINIIDNNLNNKKNSYIIDNYNDSEYQIVLKEDNKLYSLKSDIKKPNDFKNKDIKDMYTSINEVNNLVVIEYTNGGVYTFNYRTGEKVFSNFNEDIGLFEYLKRKITNDDDNSCIPNISDNQYKEIEILKNKIEKISPEEASQKIYGDNNSKSQGSKKYISVYNDITSSYDIYSVEDLLKREDLESENNKIYKDYELVRFYRNSAKKNKKFSLNGIITFGLSIAAILIALYLLVNRKKKTRSVA